MNEDQATNSEQLRDVLFIEDERFIGDLYRTALSKAGYRVSVENDGQKGLEAAQTDMYDIILLDLMLPTVTGQQILHTLRDAANTSKIHAKIIILTNLEQQGVAREELVSLADAYYIKANVSPKKLVSILNDLPFQGDITPQPEDN